MQGTVVGVAGRSQQLGLSHPPLGSLRVVGDPKSKHVQRAVMKTDSDKCSEQNKTGSWGRLLKLDLSVTEGSLRGGDT